METLQSTIFIEFDVNTKKITFLRGDNIIDYDSDVTSVYVRVKYKNLSGNTVYLTSFELEDYKFSLYTIKPATNNVNVITGEVTDELKENVYGGIVKFEIPRVCTNRLGIVKCEIHINQGNKIIGSSTFVLDVKQSLVTAFDDELLNDEDFPVLKQLIFEIQKASNINDNNISKITTYSSDKIETIKKDLSSQIEIVNNTKVNLQKVKELIVDAQLEGTEIDTSTFVRKSQLDNISLLSGNMANVEDFLLDKKILAWDEGQTRDTCIDSVAQPGWIVFNEVECTKGDVLFLLNNTEKLVGICNIFLEDGTLSRVNAVSEFSGVIINENEKYIRICYNNDSNKDLNLFQIKKRTSDLSKFEPFGNVPILNEEEKDDINTKLKDLDVELSRVFNANVEINTTIGLYNTLTKEEQFSDNGALVKAKIPVNGGEVLYINATNINDYNFKAYIILDSDDNIIASCEGYGNDELVKDLKVEVPVNGRMILLNSSYQNGIQVKKFTKTRIDDIENQVNANKAKIDVIETKVDAIENGSGSDSDSHSDSFNYENDIKRFTRTQLKHPFKYKTFDKAYVTFAFDDGTNDLDKIASIFKEFGYPMCMSLPPDSLNTICVGLQSESNGYTVNMTVKDVAKKAVEDGGEVLCHSWTPITLDNINDKELLTETFVSNVKVLRNAGFEVNGIITAGGTGALDGGLDQGGDVLQYWATIEFDYSDRYGFTEDYYHPRMNLGDSLDMNKTRIDDAINHNKWIVFFGHALQDSGNYTEENLRAILQYCKDRNVSVVPYKYIYNTFK